MGQIIKPLKLRKVIEFREGFRFRCDNELVLIINRVSFCSIWFDLQISNFLILRLTRREFRMDAMGAVEKWISRVCGLLTKTRKSSNESFGIDFYFTVPAYTYMHCLFVLLFSTRSLSRERTVRRCWHRQRWDSEQSSSTSPGLCLLEKCCR